jgi:putative ABC transport system ATP-binding protein
LYSGQDQLQTNADRPNSVRPLKLSHRIRPVLEIQNLSKSFETSEGTVPVLRDISLSVSPGDTLALTGESGSGKSTLLHLMAGLDDADSGQIVFEGQNLLAMVDAERAAVRRGQIGLVFQQFNLVPSLTVAQNLALQARLAGNHDAAHVARLTDQLGLSGLESRYPEQLSGGQQQRVAIGRTLANSPRLVLVDEPTGNLDEQTGDAVLALMHELVAESGAALVMATHSQRLAAGFARRIHLRRGQLEIR